MADDTNFVPYFDVPIGAPLIAVPLGVNGHEIVRYYTSEEAAEADRARRGARDVRHLAGAWKDLDWDEVADELDRIRHESKPTPPIDLDDLRPCHAKPA